MADKYFLIRQAVLDKAFVTARYLGHLRDMCPHLLGHKNGRAKVLLYQFGGASTSGLGAIGSDKNWRCAFVDELDDILVRPSNGVWYTADDYSPEQTCIDEIDVAAA
jgi:hypothetical protein